MLKRACRSLLVAVLFLLQGLAPLVHAHAGGRDDGPHGIHLDGLRAAFGAVAPDPGRSRMVTDASSSIGVGTLRLNDERLFAPAQLAPAPLAYPVALACPAAAQPAPAFGGPRTALHLRPCPRAPPPARLS